MATAVIGKLGNFVWEDKNGDGIQNAGEVGISGVTVKLYAQNENDGSWRVAETALSDAQGFYSLVNFSDGDTVRLQFVLPSGYGFTQSSGVITDAQNSDVVDATNGYTSNLLINNSTSNTNVTFVPGATSDEAQHNYVDAGLYKYATLSNRVWDDVDADGIQDAGELGLDGVTVNLLKADGTPTGQSVVSAGGGLYTLNNVAPGNYKLEFVPRAGYTHSPADQGTDDTKDSDVLADGKTAQFSVLSGQTINNISSGMFRYATIGNFVWNDRDVNGTQGTDSGKSGVSVELRKFSDNSVVSTTTTDVNGAYQFSKLKPGDYKVKFNLPTDFVFTSKGVGGNATKDSDVNVATGYTDKVTVTNGQTNNNIDAGIYKLNTVTGTVWADNDANGQQVASESKVSQVVVRLFQGNTEIANTRTDVNGAYSFTRVQPGTYTVKVDQPAGYLFTFQDKGNDATDSDVDRTGRSGNLVLRSDESKVVDAGLYNRSLGVAQIGNKAWLDADKDGKQVVAGNDTGVAGITVKLFDVLGHEHQTTTTNASGLYGFTEVMPGDYKVQFVAPSTHLFSPQYAGTDRALDSNANASTGWSDTISVRINDNDTSVDAGLYVPKGSISNFVWADTNVNGIQDVGESGLNGVRVKLFSSNNAFISEQTTANGGLYKFENLTQGDYYVEFVEPAGMALSPQERGADRAKDSNPDVLSGMSKKITLLASQVLNNETIDAGLYQANGVVKGTAWVDSESVKTAITKADGSALKDADGLQIQMPSVNGVQSATESKLDGVIATLYLKSGSTWLDMGSQLTHTIAGKAGQYAFTGLAYGDYKVVFTQPSGYSFTPADQGGNDSVDSDAVRNSVSGYYEAATTLTLAQPEKTLDAGLIPASSFGGKIFGDWTLVKEEWGTNYVEGDGLFAANSATNHSYYFNWGYNVLFELQQWNNNIKQFVTFSSTYSFDGYNFSDLAPGVYRIKLDWENTSEAFKENVRHNFGGREGFVIPHQNKNNKDGTISGLGNDNRDNDFDRSRHQAPSKIVYSNIYTVEAGTTIDHASVAWTSPIAFDLNHDGIKTTALGASGATFDLLGNGSKIHSGWLSQHDGFLAVDSNHNQKIDSVHELFGGAQQGVGFSKLASFDSNHDGVVNHLDAQFADLLIWQDQNENRITDAGELKTLAEVGITSLNVNYDIRPELDAQGNLHLERSAATLTDGSSIDMTDVYFAASGQEAGAAGVTLPSLGDLLSHDGALEGLMGPVNAPMTAVDVADTHSLQALVRELDKVGELVA